MRDFVDDFGRGKALLCPDFNGLGRRTFCSAAAADGNRHVVRETSPVFPGVKVHPLILTDEENEGE